jgi:hypothetical protein
MFQFLFRRSRTEVLLESILQEQMRIANSLASNRASLEELEYLKRYVDDALSNSYARVAERQLEVGSGTVWGTRK